MIIPIRCITCGKPIAHLYEDFKKRTQAGENAGEVMSDLGLKRYCCRQLFMGHVDLLKEISLFKP
ncbi:MAG: DNA-directed RNA polymerase subunit N [Candidatus Aenigmarchaeota archaeon]|nr:DNA-directed RNA polymerase subunit N [Candidatus Aenigmarchaeota archaeon]